MSKLITNLKEKLSKKIPIEKNLKKLISTSPPPIDSYFEFALLELYEFDNVDLSSSHVIRAYSNGFTSRLYKICGLEDKKDITKYLSKFDRLHYSRFINEYSNILNDKKKFYEFMFNHGLKNYLPELFGYVEEGTFTGKKDIIYHLQNENKIVLKPCLGSGGCGVYICTLDERYVFLNGVKRDLKEFRSLLNNLEKKYMVTEFCEQASFLDNLYSSSNNTMRIWTLYPGNGSPFIPIAVLRIGTEKSGFLDNLDQGGLTALIDLETGELSKGAQIKSSGKVKWHEKHPDTSAKIEGSVIPNWKSIKCELLSLVKKLPECKYVGWDLLLKENDGDFVIIEGNNRPGLKSVQVHKPLLEDPRVRKFFRENGIPV